MSLGYHLPHLSAIRKMPLEQVQSGSLAVVRPEFGGVLARACRARTEASNRGVRNREPQCRRLDAIAVQAALSGTLGERKTRSAKKEEAQD
jgi:hypothetical protein